MPWCPEHGSVTFTTAGCPLCQRVNSGNTAYVEAPRTDPSARIAELEAALREIKAIAQAPHSVGYEFDPSEILEIANAALLKK